jgi:hypothetical protein
MNAKALCTCALVLAVLGECAARAQDPQKAPAGGVSAPPPAAVVDAGPAHLPAPPGIAGWLGCGCQDGSCSSCGTSGCIFGEAYVASGVAFPFGGGVFDKALHEGWTIEVGCRSDFFNLAQDAAWTIDLSLSNTHNQADSHAVAVPLLLLSPPDPNTGAAVPPHATVASIHSLDRTFGNLTVGRVWYLNHSANVCGSKWRAGFDVGGRWGIANVDMEDLNERARFRRHTTVGGTIVAAYSDVEVPWGCCLWLFGLRTEWDSNFMDLLQSTDGKFQEINVLATVGVRF